MNPADWQRALDTDLSGLFYGSQCAARKMIPGGRLHHQHHFRVRPRGCPGRAAYCASKAACNMLTKVLAIEWAKKNIRVNAIAPGYFRTELVQGVIDKGMLPLGAIEKRTPLGRIGEVQDLLPLAVYLASDDSMHIPDRSSISTAAGKHTDIYNDPLTPHRSLLTVFHESPDLLKM